MSIDSKTTTLSGKLKPKESIDITITLRIKRPLKLAEMICIDVEGIGVNNKVVNLFKIMIIEIRGVAAFYSVFRQQRTVGIRIASE